MADEVEAPKRGRGRPKKNQQDPQGWKGRDEPTESRVTTHDGQQSTSMAVAPEPTPPEPIVLPSAEEALAVLEKLALQNQRVSTAKTRMDEAAATLKARRGTWEKESQTLSAMLTEATHRPALPLFDAQQSEADLERMEAAIDAARQEPIEEAAGVAAIESAEAEPMSESTPEIAPPAASETAAVAGDAIF